MRINSPRGKWHGRWLHKVARRHPTPLRREQNLEAILSSREINGQHGDTRIRLIRRVGRQGRVVSVSNRLRYPESSTTRRVKNLNLQLLRSNGQVCNSPIQVDRRIGVHPPLDAGRSLNLVLQQHLCSCVQYPDTAGEGCPASPPIVRAHSTRQRGQRENLHVSVSTGQISDEVRVGPVGNVKDSGAGALGCTAGAVVDFWRGGDELVSFPNNYRVLSLRSLPIV